MRTFYHDAAGLEPVKEDLLPPFSKSCLPGKKTSPYAQRAVLQLVVVTIDYVACGN